VIPAAGPITAERHSPPYAVITPTGFPPPANAAKPDGDFRILESYVRALCSAQNLIYLENQFLWSPEIAEILRDKLLNPPADDFRL
jgi:hypothetical protein